MYADYGKNCEGVLHVFDFTSSFELRDNGRNCNLKMANIPRKVFIEHFWHRPATEDASSELSLVLRGKKSETEISIFFLKFSVLCSRCLKYFGRACDTAADSVSSCTQIPASYLTVMQVMMVLTMIQMFWRRKFTILYFPRNMPNSQ